MSPFAMIFILCALLAYTIGVWSERIQGRLKVWHTVFFGLGVTFDTLGTGLMFEAAGRLTFDVHGITGIIALALMVVHALWATVVLYRRDETAIGHFHRFSVTVWFLWLVPLLSPMVIPLGR